MNTGTYRAPKIGMSILLGRTLSGQDETFYGAGSRHMIFLVNFALSSRQRTCVMEKKLSNADSLVTYVKTGISILHSHDTNKHHKSSM